MTSRPAETAALAMATLTVRVDRIIANYRHLAALAPGAECGAVVKADAYGLGAVEVARGLYAAGCNDFFVAVLSEALALREALGPKPRIIVLNGLPSGSEAVCAGAGLTPVLNSLEQCRTWARMARRPAVLQVDTGMSRFGLSVAEQEDLLGSELLGDLNLVLLMSHLANADLPDHASNAAQLQSFAEARQRFPALPASLANSAGMFLTPDCHFDLCRPGAALHGLDIGPRAHGLQQVVELTSPIVQLREINAGTGVGYGFQFTAERDMRIAVVPVGYADGWLRSLSDVGAVWFGETRLPIVGRVSMDCFIVDVTALESHAIKVGDSVELIGHHQNPDDVARLAGTIGYEILTSLGQRYHRRYVTEAEAA